MKLLTFLGAGQAHETCYVFPDGHEVCGPFCGIAIACAYKPTDVMVFVTPTAREKHLENFLNNLSAKQPVVRVQPVDIPPGRDESELWEIFQHVVNTVEEEESLIFDITHGFRSLPFLSFLAVAYLRAVKRVNIHKVFYGNFEARERNAEPPRTPVIDLTGFTELLEWMTAADLFQRFGDSTDLAVLLDRARPRGPGYPPEIYQQGKELRKLKDVLERVSRALHLIRPDEVFQTSADLSDRLDFVSKTSIPRIPLPFRPLMDHIRETYQPLSMRNPREQSPQNWLEQERQLISWYLQRKQYPQAVAVAREWLVSWYIYKCERADGRDMFDREERKKAENQIGKLLQARKQKNIPPRHFSDEGNLTACLDVMEGYDFFLNLYQQLGDLRNDMMHAGMRRKPRNSLKMETQIKDLCARIQEIPL